MDKKYIIDIKKKDENNDFVLDISNVDNLRTLDLDINSCLVSYKKALDKEELKRANEILNVLKNLTKYGDKRFSDASILFKAKEIILLHKNMDTKNIVEPMNILLKIRRFFVFLNSQITFQYNDENTGFIEEVKKIRDNINIKNLINLELYKDYNPSIEDIDIIKEFKKNFNNEDYKFLEGIYNFFEKKLHNEIKTLKADMCKENIEKYKNIFKDKYEDAFYKSNEFKNLICKNNISSYEGFKIAFDRCYLIYKFNNEITHKGKENVLKKLLVANFINIPKIYRSIVIENIIKSKKQYNEINVFFHDVNKNLENIKEEKRLNAIII